MSVLKKSVLDKDKKVEILEEGDLTKDWWMYAIYNTVLTFECRLIQIQIAEETTCQKRLADMLFLNTA
jgi:hypothetical protein